MFEKLLNLLRSDGSIIINKTLARSIGLNPTIIYSELISKYKYYQNNNALKEFDGFKWFFCTVEDLQYSTTIPRDAQIKAINVLVNFKLIAQVNKKPRGFDSQRRFFRIIPDSELLLSLLSDDLKSSNIAESRNIDFPKSKIRSSKVVNHDSNNTNINNTNINNNNNNSEIPKEIPQKKKDVVVVPSIEILKKDIEDNISQSLNNKYGSYTGTIKITLGTVKSMVGSYGEEHIRKCLSNFKQVLPDEGIRKTAVGLFRRMIEDNYEVSETTTKTADKGKRVGDYNPNAYISGDEVDKKHGKQQFDKRTPQRGNFDQREYPDEFYDSLYDNI